MSEFRVLFIHILITFAHIKYVFLEESCSPNKYIEERLLDKMVDMTNKMQLILDGLKDKNHEFDEGSVHTAPRKLLVRNIETDGWEMIFRAVSGNSQNVFNAWTTGVATCTDKPTTMVRSYSCHYRDHRVANWANLGVQQVKFAFYDDDREVAYVIFNGKESDMNNWFDKSRVISSSWPDLTSSHVFNYFSIAGHLSVNQIDRRFYINRLYNSCPKDLGHMAVMNSAVSSPRCQWDSHASYPQFIYSKINSVDFWERRMFGTADFMAIFIKQ